MTDFLEFVRDYDDHEAYAAFEDAGLAEPYRAFFAPRVLAFTWAMERLAHAEALAGARTPAQLDELLDSKPWGAYARMGETLALIDVTSCGSFAMVGSGPLPDSLIYVHEHTEVESLVGIERDPVALRMARELIEAFGLNRIRIAEGEAEEVDYGAYDVICCSVFATPRRPIIERIAATAGEDARVILRDPLHTGTLLFDRVVDALPEPLEIVAEARAEPGRLMLRRYVLGVAPGRRPRPGTRGS